MTDYRTSNNQVHYDVCKLLYLFSMSMKKKKKLHFKYEKKNCNFTQKWIKLHGCKETIGKIASLIKQFICAAVNGDLDL